MKHVIITGGSGGIGRNIVNGLIIDGYRLLIIGRSRDNYEKLISFLGKNNNIEFFQADVSNLVEVQNIFSFLSRSNQNLYGLINMAAIQTPIGEFSRNDIIEWSNNLSINLLGVSNMVYGFIKAKSNIKEKRKIINFSGGGVTSSRPNFSAYAVSKIGVVKLSEILADELNDINIDINSVSPGAINTNMTNEIIDAGEKSGDEYNLSLIRKHKGGDSVKKIVDLCQFLLSPESNNISGKLISAVWDDWKNKDYRTKLLEDKDFATLRRIDEKYYKKIR